jgi:3-phenylpropionate/trans-cinnamate dioxygenase ferredoxin reductase component
MSDGVVIAGGGQAGFQTAVSLRGEGYQEPITIISDEVHLPYQRPPLSKAFLLGKQDAQKILLRPESYYAEHGIRLLSGERAVAIETPEHRVRLGSGTALSYDSLVLAVGSRNRILPVPGAELEGVCYLRTLSEAVEIKQRAGAAEKIVIIGGGFIGLEIAASARTLGKEVTVVELLPRLMARVVAPVVSEFFQRTHAEKGVNVLLGAQVEQIRDSEVLLTDGTVLPADLVVIGIGVVPNAELAAEAGLETSNGIVADPFLRSSDERVYAIGDCVSYHNRFAGDRVRLESVQNAVDQAVNVARTIAGKPAPYHVTPWFWSDQFEVRMQMTGLASGHDRVVVRGDPESGKFSVFYFRQNRLCAVDSINRPADHLAARKLIASGAALTPEEAADENVNLKSKT